MRAIRARAAVRGWLRRIPWHNWGYAGYYATMLQLGISAIQHPPQTIEGAAGPWLTALWAALTTSAAAVGLWGAVAPSIVVPWPHRVAGRWHLWRRLASPNFRMEQAAAVLAWFGIFIYASTIWGIVWFTDAPTRQASAWSVTAHFWPFLLRFLYFHISERKEQEKVVAVREVEERMRREGTVAPLTDGGADDRRV